MNELSKANGSTQITAQEEIINAHQFLKEFIEKFDHAKRGGIHDFMEIALYNMISASIKGIDKYLQTGHHEVSATQIMHITVDAWQKVLDGIKRNLGEMRPVNFR
jgi:phosphopantothenate synthetase